MVFYAILCTCTTKPHNRGRDPHRRTDMAKRTIPLCDCGKPLKRECERDTGMCVDCEAFYSKLSPPQPFDLLGAVNEMFGYRREA